MCNRLASHCALALGVLERAARSTVSLSYVHGCVCLCAGSEYISEPMGHVFWPEHTQLLNTAIQHWFQLEMML